MSAIIKFPLEKVRRTSTHTKSDGETATVLVFQGVQYSSQKRAALSKSRAKQTNTTTKGRKQDLR